MARSLYYYWKNVIALDKIKDLNKKILQNVDTSSSDRPAHMASKTSTVKSVRYNSIKEDLTSAVERINFTNQHEYGYDVHPLLESKILNYNIYRPGTEYTWHVDMDKQAACVDIKLTALINLSETKVKGGDFLLFEGYESKATEFDQPGSMVIFPSFYNHKVTKISSGVRRTLAIFMYGPKWR
jgi:PKHD-type hydroxylase|tara:strand:- start:2234 stop:2782 length:549 start_codon:yes stop_codon:yes gene_type:complete